MDVTGSLQLRVQFLEFGMRSCFAFGGKALVLSLHYIYIIVVFCLIGLFWNKLGPTQVNLCSERFSKEFPFSAGSFSDTNSNWRLQILPWYFEKPGIPNACLWNLSKEYPTQQLKS